MQAWVKKLQWKSGYQKTGKIRNGEVGIDMSGKNNLELEKRGDKPLAYDHPPMSGEWQFNDANFVNSSMGPISNGMNSHGPSMWEHPLDSVSIGLNGMNVDSDGVIASDPLSMLKGSLFVPSTPTMLPHSLSEFPADSAFIERAARFSSFSGGHFSELLNPLGSQSVSSYLCGGGTMMQGPQGLLSGNAMKMLPNTQPQTSDGNVAETSRDVSLSQDHGVAEVGSPMNKIMVSRNDSDGPEFSGGGSREGRAPSSVKRLGANKRKRSNQDIESEQANAVQQQSGEAGKKQAEIPQKGEQNSVPTANKSNGKQSSQNSDPPKDDYIHVRARRGQATNSHSLAERVRREKISERMKFLQDLVPGCSKVTGKAVMLDEIINYVQSLQRQVEFLSMKLATVHPKLDFNIDQLLAKDQMLSARSCPSGVGSSPSMPMAYPPLHPGIANCSDFLRRTISSQLTNMGEGYKEPAHQLPNAWEDELHNVVQMGFNASDSLDNQETICPTSQGSMEAEP